MTDWNSVCYLCASRPVERLQQFPWLVKCLTCGLVYNPNLSVNVQNVSQQFYDEANMDHRKRIQSVLLDVAKTRWHWLIQRLPIDRGSLLEIGCGTGEFLITAKKAGWKARGLELSDSFRRAARDWYDLDLTGNELEPANLPSDSFDTIALLHVFEHLPNPLEFLEGTARVLKQDGWLFIIVPNLSSWIDNLFGTLNPTLIKRDHFFHYTCSTLFKMISQADFTVVELGTYEPSHHVWTSLYSYLAMSRKALGQQHSPERRGGSHSLFRRLRSNLPYWAGAWSCFLLFPFRVWLEKNNRGHEIYLLCRRRR